VSLARRLAIAATGIGWHTPGVTGTSVKEGLAVTDRYDHRDEEARLAGLVNEDDEIRRPVMDGAEELREEAVEALENDDSIEDPAAGGDH
jgi:hypothetical protein